MQEITISKLHDLAEKIDRDKLAAHEHLFDETLAPEEKEYFRGKEHQCILIAAFISTLFEKELTEVL